MKNNHTIRALSVIAAPVVLFFGAWFVDPVRISWLPKCILHELTGLNCPGCGLTRAAHYLAHGNVAAAVAMNPLAPLLMALGGYILLYELLASLGRPFKHPKALYKFHWLFWIGIVLFGILRNIPVYPFNLLAPH